MTTEVTKAALDAAHWVTASPHEWKWTLEQQVAMARYCVLASSVLHEAARDLEKIVCTKEPDEGVILLSSEAATHYDANFKCDCYDYEYFSPLGEALIALHHRLLSLRTSEPSSDAGAPADWRIGLTVKPKYSHDELKYERGKVLAVLQSGTNGIVDNDGVLKIQLESGTTILRRADDWITA